MLSSLRFCADGDVLLAVLWESFEGIAELFRFEIDTVRFFRTDSVDFAMQCSTSSVPGHND